MKVAKKTTREKAVNTPTMQEMLIDVLNATIDAYGNVAVQVTRCRNNTCPTHTENEYLVFAENSIQRSEWIMADTSRSQAVLATNGRSPV